MRAKKTLLILILATAIVLIVSIGLAVVFYNPERPVKINAGNIGLSAKKPEVERLLKRAYAVSLRNKQVVLGASAPLEVKKEDKPVKADFSFNAIAPSWEDEVPAGTQVTIQVRSSNDGKSWSDWKVVEEDEDGNAKDEMPATKTYGRLIVAQGNYLQGRMIFKTTSLEAVPIVKDLQFTYIDSKEKRNLFEKLLKKIKLRAKQVFAASPIPINNQRL